MAKMRALFFGYPPTEQVRRMVHSAFPDCEEVDFRGMLSGQDGYEKTCADAEKDGRKPVVIFPPLIAVLSRGPKGDVLHAVDEDGVLRVIESVEIKFRDIPSRTASRRKRGRK